MLSISTKLSFRVAFCGMTAALMTTIMLLGTLIPFTTFFAPMLAGCFLLPVIWEYDGKAAALLYLAVSLLSFFLAPDREAAFLFICLFGWYPLAHNHLQHISAKPVRIALKLLLFNLSAAAVYALLYFVFVSPDFQAELIEQTKPALIAFILMADFVFLLYDRCMPRITEIYVCNIRPKLLAGRQH